MNVVQEGYGHFVGLGPGKAGTTFVYGFLARHPEVATGKIKESYFFSENFDKGVQWYLKLKGVPLDRSDNTKLLIGDISNQYFKDLTCIDNIELTFPGSKYLFFKRDPLDRLLSCYKFEKKMGSLLSFNEFLKTQKPEHFNNECLLDEIYAKVSIDRVHVIHFTDLVQNYGVTIGGLCDFLGISYINFDITDYKNTSVKPRSGTLVRHGRKVAAVLRSFGLYSALQSLKGSRFLNNLMFTPHVIKVSEDEIVAARNFLANS